jgi:hypothetical protein
MPQMKIDRKFFRVRTDEFLQNIAPKSDRTIAVTEFQGFPENITGGKE